MELDYMICLVLLFLCVVSSSFRSDVYPSQVEKYKVRLDHHTGKPVQSGLMHSLPNRSTISDFKRHLQCSVSEPNLNYNGGMITRLVMRPLTTKHLKYICAYIEEQCNERFLPINKCKRSDFDKYYNGSFYKPYSGFNVYTPFATANLLRVIKGQLYYDWPWGIERINEVYTSNPVAPLLQSTLSRITDMNDSVFFTGGADPNIPLKIDMPMFSFCTSDEFAEMVFPWLDMWLVATRQYKTMRMKRLEFVEASYQKIEPGYRPWKERIAKAALFCKYQPNRHFLLDVARQNPDLIDAKAVDSVCIQPWHPLSTERCKYHDIPEGFQFPSADRIEESQSQPAGYAFPLFNLTVLGEVTYQPGAYKYVIVPLGQNEFLSTSSRMSHLLAFSGAVILMPRSSLKFHFSAQLRPWVHYVPISFTGADVAEKVRWLREHDDLAEQIAENGRAFARSYLRLEDYYCYAAQVLQVMSELTASEKTSVTKDVFSPQKLAPFYSPQLFEYDFVPEAESP